MASPTKRVYWDACVWLALILREKIPLPGGGMATVVFKTGQQARKPAIT